MNKKLLGLIITSVLLINSLPLITSAKVNNSTSANINFKNDSTLGGVLLRGGSNLYSAPGGRLVGYVAEDKWVQIHIDDPPSSWFHVCIDGKWFYVHSENVVTY